MPESRSSAAHASVAHLRMPGFARSPAAERANLRKELQGSLRAAIGRMDDADRIVLDAPEGMVVVFLGDPAAALDFAQRLLAANARLKPAIGLSHGPVRVLQDSAGGPTLVGGALSEATVAARFASAGSVTATRSYRDALGRAAPAAARGLVFAGSMNDERDRGYELFHADAARMRARRRRFFGIVGGIAGALVVLGAAGRVMRLRQPGVVELDITPAGEVFVNGASRGSSPPLRRFELPAGKYELEVRSGRYKPLVIELELEAGERVTVVHSFTSPRASRSFKQRVFEFFR